jgi:hypothetical protein
MKNDNPVGNKLHFASAGQRMLSLLVFVVFAALIWVAWSGRYDREVNRVAGWMRTHWHALVD